MIEKKLTKYDKARLKDLAHQLNKARQDYLAICEAIFAHDLNLPNKKTDYLSKLKWQKDRVDLERRMRAIIRNYERAFVRYCSLADVITDEMSKGVY